MYIHFPSILVSHCMSLLPLYCGYLDTISQDCGIYSHVYSLLTVEMATSG